MEMESVTLKEGYGLRVFENRVLKGYFYLRGRK
jgi:hypothetical protein